MKFPNVPNSAQMVLHYSDFIYTWLCLKDSVMNVSDLKKIISKYNSLTL